MSPENVRDKRKQYTVGEITDALVGVGADEFLIEASEAEEVEFDDVIVMDEDEVKELFSTFGLTWNEERRGLVITGPPASVERMVMILAVTFAIAYLLTKVIEAVL
jgi:hypothetical protein